MKKVLFITHLPRVSERIRGFVTYLPEFGWQPIVLTGETDRFKDLPCEIIETPYKNVLGNNKDLLGMKSNWLTKQIGSVVNYPDFDKGWLPYALETGSELVSKVDAIFSSSPPVISHIIASKLKGNRNIPWVADLRDLWSQNSNYSYPWWRQRLDRRLELQTLVSCDKIITTSSVWAERVSKLHHKKAVCITHGFNPAEVNEPPRKLTENFTVTYTGTIYPKWQNMEAVREAIARTHFPIELRIYNNLSHQEAVEKQQESQLLLVLDWDDLSERGLFPQKLFEYLAAKRPILAMGGGIWNVVDEFISETRVGFHCSNIFKPVPILLDYYEAFKKEGDVPYNGDWQAIQKYSFREKARELAQVLDGKV